MKYLITEFQIYLPSNIISLLEQQVKKNKVFHPSKRDKPLVPRELMFSDSVALVKFDYSRWRFLIVVFSFLSLRVHELAF